MFRFDLSPELSQTVMGLLGKRPDERPFDVSTFKSALEQRMAGAMIAEDEPEEQPSQLHIAGAGQSSPVETPADLPEAPGKDRAPTNVVVMPEPDTPVLVEQGPVAADAAVAPDVRAQDRGLRVVDVAASLPEVDDGRGRSDRIVIDLFEELPEDARENEWGEFIEASEVPLREESSREESSREESSTATSRRLVWLLVLLLIGGGLFGAIRGWQFRGKAENTAASAEQRTGDELAASKAEVFVPGPQSTTLEGATKLTPKLEPATRAAGDIPPDSREGGSSVVEKKEAREDVIEKPSPSKPSESLPSTDSPVEQVLTPKSASPVEVKGVDLRDRQSIEPAPVPERPVKAEAPAPRVIRRSGDVLQNTAVIRPGPVYPKAAREAKIKGSVTVELTIDEEGSVVAARPISGPDQLRDAAVTAARRWKWTPARVDRNRAGVVGTITFVFKD